MIGVDWQNVTFDSITLDEAENSMLKFSFEQEIPFPGKLSLKKKIAARDSDAEEKSYRATERRVIADLKVAYYDWYLAGKAIEITERNGKSSKSSTKSRKLSTKWKGHTAGRAQAQVEIQVYRTLEVSDRKRDHEAKMLILN
jgi:outer membrane protein TolC